MPMNKKSIRTVIFDYCNTLVEFGKKQVMFCDMALGNVLEKHFGRADLEKLAAIRTRNRMAPFAGDPPEYRENNLVEITTSLVQALYGIDPSSEELADILHTRFQVFVRAVQAQDYVFDVLKVLGKKYKLGLLSNYPDGNAIRQSLINTGLARFFSSIVVSGDLGLAKPHPVPFLTALDELGVGASQAVLVGDNWLADVQGGKRAGLQVILTTQWEPADIFNKKPGDSEPDAIVTHLTEIIGLL